ncbi:hypothetical protein RHMOL_Rhmol07G0221200 [Rhododendron molle]|uniref:Uncharacterized protein n=1 Tax=Rhododendron molle TaxID=49168 RepID=A0ACC0N5B1_RHOML|nr:hypothetical protein RHMOL_Rhmol07G0221200 [Rhododendron molle]
MGYKKRPIGGSKIAQHISFKSGHVDKWAFLFKRSFKSKLTAIKNKKWVQRGDPGGGTSYKGAASLEREDVGLLVADCDRRTPIEHDKVVGDGKNSQATTDFGEVCMIPDRFSPSLPSSFSFLEEGGGGGFSAGRSLGADSLSSLKERVVEAVCEGRVSEVWCSGEDILLGGSFGRRRFSMELGEGLGMGRVLKGCVTEAGEGGVNSKGLELVPFF